MNIFIILLYTGFTALALISLKRYKISPAFWFLLAQWLMAVGTIVLVDLEREDDVLYIALYFVALFSFLAGASILSHFQPIKMVYARYLRQPVELDEIQVRKAMIILVVVAAMITMLYYWLAGYNLFWEILSGAEIDDYSAKRLAMYSGDTYLAPGYVNQFKNVLLPLLFVTIAVWTHWTGHRRAARVLVIAGLPFLFLALAGTGQRGFILYTVFAIMFGAAIISTGRQHTSYKHYLILPLFVVIVVFVIMTQAYKSSEGTDAAIEQTMDRFFTVQQDGGLVGFRYIYSQEIVWFNEWAAGFVGILPGVEGSLLAHEIHKIMYGSELGTVPVTTVGSAYYNGGVICVIVFFFLLGWAYAALFYRLISGRRTVLRSFTYGFLFFYLATYVAGPPVSLIDNGVVTLMLLLVIRKILGNYSGTRCRLPK
jgi:oligosaccharide repeat unit polymerase